jgi:hypothetical protein
MTGCLPFYFYPVKQKSIAMKNKFLILCLLVLFCQYAAAKELGYDFSGVDKPKNEKDFYGLRYAAFVVPLVKAVQEQQQIIDELKQSNSSKQKWIEELMKRIEKLESNVTLKK